MSAELVTPEEVDLWQWWNCELLILKRFFFMNNFFDYVYAKENGMKEFVKSTISFDKLYCAIPL
ncbi:MAG: hypothetical protein D3910_21220 [Candidatus Electrothrix sp. ATG2]|nr:hypothetical protein [Candidatus Electrothrix sp. ATG2]